MMGARWQACSRGGEGRMCFIRHSLVHQRSFASLSPSLIDGRIQYVLQTWVGAERPFGREGGPEGGPAE